MVQQHTPEALNDAYTELWHSFATGLQAHTEAIRKWASEPEAQLHDLLRRAYWTPKHFLQAGTHPGGDQEPNVGSATGLFFEHLGASAISARLLTLVTATTAHRNARSSIRRLGVPKQPDLLVHHVETGRSVVFEFKASPKAGDVAAVRAQRRTWEADASVRFYLVVGLAGDSVVDSLREDGWAAVLRNDIDGEDLGLAGRPTIDDLVRSATDHLTGIPSDQ